MSAHDLFARITRQIADAIAAGAETYTMPWHRWGEALAQPVNAMSGRQYRGVNCLLLWAAAEQAGYRSGRWATYKQWSEAGAQVRKGERGTAIFFWRSAAKDEDDREAAEDSQWRSPRYIAKVYALFNSDQVDGCEESMPRPSLSPAERIAAADEFVASTGADIRHGGDCAAYVPSLDVIRMPRFEQFRDAEAYYGVLAHECIHWSGAKHRLDRDLAGRFASQSYAIEELVAELGSAFIAAQLGIAIEPRRDHASYVASWLKVLHGDPRAILTAASKAQQAVDYLFGLGQAAADGTAPSERSVAS